MRPTPVPADLLAGPFTLAQSRAAGVPDAVLRGKRFRPLFHRVYASADLPDGPGLRIAGALLAAPPGSFAVLTSAAHLLGLPEISSSERPQVGLPPAFRKPRTHGIDWHPYGREPSLTRAGGLLATDPVSTFLDVAAHRRFVDAVIIGDALSRRGLVSCEELMAAAAQVRGRAGLRASRAAAYVRPRVDSPMETRLRLLIVFAGLPEPVTNRDVYSPQGWWLARPDLSWPQVKVSVEYDGAHHFASDQQRRSDNRRRTRMSDHGWLEIVAMSDDCFVEPWRLLERIRRVLAERALPGVQDRLDGSWREVA